MPLKIVDVNPLEHEAALKALMTAHDVVHFPDFFDRGYPSAVRDGARSWIGLDESGTVQMNVTMFVHRFDFGGRTVVAGMLGNLMAASEYRTFFPAMSLLKRLVRDVRESGGIDFLYGDPGPENARAIFIGAGIKKAGELERLALPTSDDRLATRLAARAYAGAISVRDLFERPRATVASGAACMLGELETPISATGVLRPHHPVDLLRRRLADFPSATDYCITLRSKRSTSAWDALALMRGPGDRGILVLNSLRRRPELPVSRIVPSLVRFARDVHATRIFVEVVKDSVLAQELIAAGFRSRNDSIPLFTAAFTPLGEEVIRLIAGWELTGVDMER